MPITYTIDSGRHFLSIAATGTVTVSDMRTFLRTVGGDPLYRPDFRSLADLTQASPFEASGSDVWGLANEMPMAPGARLAIVVASDLHFGFARIAAQVRGGGGIAIAAFRDRDEAMRWLDTLETQP